MRREDFMFTDYDELEIIAQRCHVGYLGMHDPDGYPRVIPLNFHLMNPCIYFQGAEVGVSFVVLLQSLAVGFGSSAFIYNYPTLFRYLQVAGALYLLYLAYRFVRSSAAY